ncbi:MAG: hypothetical protein ACYC27_19155 [Armatimonadota bacterium]
MGKFIKVRWCPECGRELTFSDGRPTIKEHEKEISPASEDGYVCEKENLIFRVDEDDQLVKVHEPEKHVK